MELKKIILVFKTHFDIGFTDLSSNVIDQYAKEMAREVIATCKGTQDMGALRYVWTMPSWPLLQIVKNATPEVREELDKLIENGQVVWHALPFTSHTDFCSQKEYIEGLRYSVQLAEMYHKPCPISAKMTDVPGHSIMLPDILYEGGVRFLHLGCNEFATPPDVPDLFYWQTPGGRSVLTMYSRGGYGSGLVPPKGWNYPVWMALMHTQDNQGPQSASAIRQMAEQIHEIYPNAEIVCGTMDDFYHELSQYDLSTLPVLEKDMADTWIHGVGAYPKEVALIRNGRRRMSGLQAQYLGEWQMGYAKPQLQKIQDAYYEEIALFEEHTWGADVKTWMGPNRVYEKKAFQMEKDSDTYRFMEASWEEQRQRANRSTSYLKQIEQLLFEREDKEEYSLFYGGEGSYTGWVQLPDAWRNETVLVDGQEAVCEEIQGKYCCYVSDLKGFSPVTMKKVAASKGANTHHSLAVQVDPTQREVRFVENHRYCVRFREGTGEILEVFDKKLQKAILKAQNKNGVFSYQYDKYGYSDINEYLRHYGYHFTTWGIQDYGRENYPVCEHETFLPEFADYCVNGNAISFRYRTKDNDYGDAKEVILEIALPAAGEELFVKLSLKQKQETPFVESGSILFPFGDEEMTYRINKGGCILNPAEDIADGANHSLYCMEGGLAAFGKDYGVCVKSFDAALAALGGTGIYKFSPAFEEAKEQCAYVNLFN
ncbi:MAG: hypothetical protein K6G30_10280, partial [Acetatifactor sp.]|nr:hypothetical protein [Acetatifactor sp.]